MLLYITAASEDEAKLIARTLLHKRLVACINIFPALVSMYPWEGQIQQATEVAMIAKSVAGHVDAIIAAVKEISSYSCPCVVSMAIDKGNIEFLEWIGKTTASPSDEEV